MNDLDKKLKEILDSYEEQYFCTKHANKSWDDNVDTTAIEQIKQAFVQAGWLAPEAVKEASGIA